MRHLHHMVGAENIPLLMNEGSRDNVRWCQESDTCAAVAMRASDDVVTAAIIIHTSHRDIDFK
jgi:hypothetical protein